MTLVLAVHNRDTFWVLVDRRLSYGRRRPPIDDAVKITELETADGRGVLAYAGLGATSAGTQPSSWMSAVLRGRGGMTFEQTLGVLSDVANRELAKHLTSIPAGAARAHFIVVPAFVRAAGYRLYVISNEVDPKARQHWYSYERIENTEKWGALPPRIVVGGTGGFYLQRKGTGWARTLISLTKAHDEGKVSDLLVADQLAAINREVHHGVRDGTVGPRCIVVWRRRPGVGGLVSGGAHQSYTGLSRDQESPLFPAIANGLDSGAIVGLLMEEFRREAANWVEGDPLPLPFPADFDRLIQQLPSDPEDELR